MAGKYSPLEKYLRELPESQSEVTLRFEQIESILNTKLPASAYEGRGAVQVSNPQFIVSLRATAKRSHGMRTLRGFSKTRNDM